VHSQSWTLDAMGNWIQFNSDATSQTRTANRQNEVTSISGQTTPTYDNNGNTTKDNSGKQFVYDAWNRIVKVKDQNGVLLGNYAYDALGRRIQEPIDAAHARDLYFSTAWQVLEERDTNGAVVRAENVWSPVYLDALILRDRDPSGTGSFSERLYVQQDANWNVTAVISSSGAVQERYVYDPYGQASFLDPVSWAVRGGGPNGASQYAWVYLHQGGRFDLVSGLFSFRSRDYSSSLGRWMQQDPIRYRAGDTNLYRYLDDAPTERLDPRGLMGAKMGPNGEYQGPLYPWEIWGWNAWEDFKAKRNKQKRGDCSKKCGDLLNAAYQETASKWGLKTETKGRDIKIIFERPCNLPSATCYLGAANIAVRRCMIACVPDEDVQAGEKEFESVWEGGKSACDLKEIDPKKPSPFDVPKAPVRER
jgi:RHS repeat-associated protein